VVRHDSGSFHERSLSQRRVNIADDGSTFADGRRYPLRRTGPDIADRKDVRQTGFQLQGAPFVYGNLLCQAVTKDVPTRDAPPEKRGD